MKKLFILLAVIVYLFVFQNQAEAVSTPDFSTCANPQGTQIAHFTSGTHGIVGTTATYTGSDSVYKQSTNQLVQCFCPLDGKGVQTNWLKASSYSEAEIKVLKSQGWIYIASGSVWGLESEPYVAQNISYKCNGATGSSNNSSQQAVIGASTGPGFTFTGNSRLIFVFTTIGIASLFLGLRIRKSS